jgi:hypothetical protein
MSLAACLLTLLAARVTDDDEDASLLLRRVTESLRQFNGPRSSSVF